MIDLEPSLDVYSRYQIAVSEFEQGRLCESDARLLWGEIDDACRSVLALAAQTDLAVLQPHIDELAARLADAKDRVREMF